MASRRLPSTLRLFGVRYMSGEWGSGAGKGGGAGGSVREAGGSFGKMEAAQEEQYFRKLRGEQLAKLRDMMEDEVEYHEKQLNMHKQAAQIQALHDHLEEEVKHHELQINQHQDAIERHKKKISQLKHQEAENKKK